MSLFKDVTDKSLQEEIETTLGVITITCDNTEKQQEIMNVFNE